MLGPRPHDGARVRIPGHRCGEGAIRVFDWFSVTLSVAPVVSLPSFMGVVMVIVIAMGLSGGAATDASDSNQKRSNAETLGERHG